MKLASLAFILLN